MLVLLSLNSGATDAIGFVALGGAFTSVMTGNMILLGISVTNAVPGVASRAGLAIVLFIGGAFVGSRIAGIARPGDPTWPASVTRALVAELGALLAFSVGWWASGSHPEGHVQLVLLGADAIALGIQSSAITRFGVSGLSTTYMTGTLTTLVATLAQGRSPRNVIPSAQILAGLIAGAALAAALATHAPAVERVLQLAPLIASVVWGVASNRWVQPDLAPRPEAALQT
jgi:uncharacterized membrane protein YoaK (UPF0700 family)